MRTAGDFQYSSLVAQYKAIGKRREIMYNANNHKRLGEISNISLDNQKMV